MTTTAAPAPAATSAPTPASTPGPASQAPPTEAGATPVKAATPPKTYEVKINGKVHRMSEDEVVARAQHSEAAEQRFNEAAKMRKEAETVIGRLRDPEQVIDALMDPSLGLTKDQIREKFEAWYEREFIEPDKLTEDQKKLRDAEAKIKKYADDESKREQARVRAEEDQLTEKARGEIQAQLIEVLETGNLDKSEFTLNRIAHWARRNHLNNFNAPTAVLVAQVKKDLESMFRSVTKQTSIGRLIEIAGGDSFVQEVRKWDLERLRKLRGGGGVPVQESSPMTEERRERAPTSADVTRRLRELQSTGKY